MEKRVKRYVVFSYIVFWFMVLGLCGTASMVFHCSPVVMRVLSNVCAWAPTIVLLIGFKYFCPGQTIGEFYKKAFGGRISIVTLAVSAIITLGDGNVIHAWDVVRKDNYLEIENMTALSGYHPKYIGWVPLERVLAQSEQ